MKITPVLELVNTETFLNDYLTVCGIEDVEHYLSADYTCFDNPWDYKNMDRAVERLEQGIKNGEKIGILCDSDSDGVMSSALIYNYIKEYNSNEITPFFHKGKAHGLRTNTDENLIQQIIDSESTLLLVPDAGSSDVNEMAELKQHGIDTIVTDHHLIDKSSDFIVVNNTSNDNQVNNKLSGTGVTHKLALAHYDKYGKKGILNPLYLCDFVAVSLVSDMCDMISYENRAYIAEGFKVIKSSKGNSMLKAMVEKFNRRGLTQLGFSWGSVPCMNSLTRIDDDESKQLFFKSLVGEYEIPLGLHILDKARDAQRKEVDEAVSEARKTVKEYDNLIIGFVPAQYKNFTGLIANKYCGEKNKPTLILREASPTTWSGSMRSPIPLLKEINETKLAKCQGHNEACGCFAKKSNLPRLVNWFNNQSFDLDPNIQVAGKLEIANINKSICKQCGNNATVWSGSDKGGIPEPKFYVAFNSSPNKLIVYEKATTTVKFSFGNVDIMKFIAKREDVKKLRSDKCKIEAIVTLDVNVWNGHIMPQAKIESWEITPLEEEETNWMDLF